MWFSRVRSFAFDTYRRLEIRQHQLLYLFLEITRHCNLSCLHCGSDCGRTGDSIKELTTASWLLLIDDIRRSFGPDVMLVLTGGEPLLHPDLEEITGHIASHAMRWGLVTNGHGLTGARLASFIDHGIGSITISLDGPEAAHDSLRNLPGAYSKTTDAMCRIGAAAIPMRDVVTCIHPGNLDRLDETAEIILASAIPAWRLFRIFPSGARQRGRTCISTSPRPGECLTGSPRIGRDWRSGDSVCKRPARGICRSNWTAGSAMSPFSAALA